jgi:hypothetical protein
MEAGALVAHPSRLAAKGGEHLRMTVNDDFVMRGLDPRIHRSSQEFSEEDGLPGQARQ